MTREVRAAPGNPGTQTFADGAARVSVRIREPGVYGGQRLLITDGGAIGIERLRDALLHLPVTIGNSALVEDGQVGWPRAAGESQQINAVEPLLALRCAQQLLRQRHHLVQRMLLRLL